MKSIKIAYIGGGSRLWARSLMSDLALSDAIGGVVSLYDIDVLSARNNAIIGNLMMERSEASHAFRFEVASSLDECLQNSDFVFISILPGTFDEMEAYVHIPEKWNVYQTVGDTTSVSGIFRSLIMMPMFEVIAKAIERNCPNSWVINFTNPMTMCVETLYHVFPKIKAFGNCHEVFFVQRILARALKEKTGIVADYKEININPQGINHFTWINYATYQDIDLIPIYSDFVNQYHAVGLQPGDQWKAVGPFGSAERVKLDLFKRFGVIAAAGDRHLVEFLPHSWYMKDQSTIDSWRFHLTPVQMRKDILKNGNESALRIVNGLEPVQIHPSGEEGIAQVKSILGLETLVTNVNMPNVGQIPNLPLGHVVETNAYFRKDDVKPIFSGEMPAIPAEMTRRHMKTHSLLLKAFDERNLSYALEAMNNDPSLEHLSNQDRYDMFQLIKSKMKHYLDYYDR